MKNKNRELELLKEAFNKFIKASDELKLSYASLKDRAIKLETELKIVNKKLKTSLEEKENLYYYLKNIIESINVAIIIIDNSKKISLYNKLAKKLLPNLKKGISEKCFEKSEFSEVFKKSFNSEDDFEKEFKTKEGKYYLLSFGKLKSKAKNIGKFIMIKDISSIKKLEAEAQRNSRLKAMGEMAAELSHEIRNPLGSIELYASMLEEDLKKENYNTEYITFIRDEIKKLNSLVTNILLFTREIKPKKREINIENFIKNIDNFTKPMLKANNIKIKYDFNVKTVYFDPDLFERVFFNLILNSINALEGKLDPIIKISCSKKNNNVLIKFKDNGIGIKDDLKDKIFNPFFTTKAKGSGLGLSVIYRIVKAHNGNIQINSKEGEYTEFIIELMESDND